MGNIDTARWKRHYRSIVFIASCRSHQAKHYAAHLKSVTGAKLIGIGLAKMRKTLWEIPSFDARYWLAGRADRFPGCCQNRAVLDSLRAHEPDAVVVGYANERGRGYENVCQFAASLGRYPVFAITPSLAVQRIPRSATRRALLEAFRAIGSALLWTAAWFAGCVLVALCLGRLALRRKAEGARI